MSEDDSNSVQQNYQLEMADNVEIRTKQKQLPKQSKKWLKIQLMIQKHTYSMKTEWSLQVSRTKQSWQGASMRKWQLV